MGLSFPVASQHNAVDPPPDAHWAAVQICGGPMAWPSTASAIRSMFPVMKTIAKNVDPSQTQEHRVGKTQLAHGIPTCSDQTSSQSCISLRYIPDTMAQWRSLHSYVVTLVARNTKVSL